MLRILTVYSSALQRPLVLPLTPKRYGTRANSEPTSLNTCTDIPSESTNTSASARLWADATEKEESQESRRSHPRQSSEYPNWTGDESTHDAVLRMLVDKYKPLRSGVIRSAEEKIHTDISSTPPLSQSSTSTDTHKPWLTTFHVPSHVASAVPTPLPPPQLTLSSSKPTSTLTPSKDDMRIRIQAREQKRKEAYAARIVNAKEGSLDYQIGLGNRKKSSPTLAESQNAGEKPIPNPVSMRGWTSLVEERIERARQAGQFAQLKGRGKPIIHESDQSNPFIPREEFLMNRIVQRQGAAPVWVEYQGELDTAINAFRTILRNTWTRRALRVISLSYPPSLLHTIGRPQIQQLRDEDWEEREKAYHERAIEEINRLIRRYNGVAPYAVRRTYTSREKEVKKMYEEAWEGIITELKNRKNEGGNVGVWGDETERSGGGNGSGEFEGINKEGVVASGTGWWKTMWERWVARFVA